MAKKKEKDIEIREQEMVSKMKELWDRFETNAVGRTPFQMEHFVIAQHDTLARQWKQAIIELEGQYFEMQRVRIETEKEKAKVAHLQKQLDDAKDKDLNDFQYRMLELRLEEAQLAAMRSELTRIMRVRELETLYALLQRLEDLNGGPFTREQLDADEARYWAKRLTRQAYLSATSGHGFGQGNLEALGQMMRPAGAEIPDTIELQDMLLAVKEIMPPEVQKLLLEEPNGKQESNGTNGEHESGE